MKTTTLARLENSGSEDVDNISFTANAFLDVDVEFEDQRPFRLERRDDRYFLFLEKAIAPDEAIDLRVSLEGIPRFNFFSMRGSWGSGASFALLYRQHKKGPHRRTNLALSTEAAAISKRRIELANGTLTPLFRYTTWQLTDPPAVLGDPGLQVRHEEVQPVEDIRIDLTLPAGIMVADVCANASISDTGEPMPRLRGTCRTAAKSYFLRGGPLKIAASGEVVLFSLPGHEEQARSHLPALEEVTRLSASAWPGLEPVDSLVAIEWPTDLEWGRFARNNSLDWNPVEGWTSSPPRVYGQLMSIPERRLVLSKPLSSAELVEQILTRRVTEKRFVAPREQQIFRQLIATAMSQRMGLGHELGAAISGKPWDKFWAAQPIFTEDNRRHLLFDRKLEGIGIELIARSGATAFYEGVNAFLAVESEQSGTLEELFSHLERHSSADLQNFWDQYFTDAKGLPEMRLGQVEVRTIGDSFLVEGEVENVGTGRAQCPVVIKAEGQSRTVQVEVDAKSTTSFEVRLDRQPLSALLDPEKVCYRWVNVASGMVERVALGGTAGEQR